MLYTAGWLERYRICRSQRCEAKTGSECETCQRACHAKEKQTAIPDDDGVHEPPRKTGELGCPPCLKHAARIFLSVVFARHMVSRVLDASRLAPSRHPLPKM